MPPPIASAYRICVCYHYYEANPNYQRNFLHFLTFGTAINAKIICIISGGHSVSLPNLAHVQYVFTENKNWDYGGYAHVLNEVIDYRDYDYIAFVNSSVRGPFLSPATPSNWLDSFLQFFDDGVGIVGAAINVLPNESLDTKRFARRFPTFAKPYSHVQTTAYVLSQRSLEVLFANQFYSIAYAMQKDEAIDRYEILLSQLLLRAGFNLKCLLPEYNQIDYRQPHQDPNPTSYNGDPAVVNGYFGRTLHPYEGVFIKTERGLCAPHYLEMLTNAMVDHIHPKPIYMEPIALKALLPIKWKSDLTESINFKKARKSLKRYLKSK